MMGGSASIGDDMTHAHAPADDRRLDARSDKGSTLRVDTTALARASQSYLDQSQKLFAALRILRARGPIAAAHVGSVDHADELARRHEDVLGVAGSAFERFIAVMEVDVDKLLRLAFAYQQAEEETARRFKNLWPPR
jgi:hypothetical protein